MMDKKKICLVIASPLTIHFFLLGQIEALARKYDLTVITNTDDPGFLEYLGVSVRVIPVGIERKVSLWRDLSALVRLVLVFSLQRFDLVHSLSPKSGLLAMVAAWIARVPVRVHTFQGEVWATRKGLWRAFLKMLDKVVVRLANHLLVVSSSEEEFLIEQRVVSHGQLKMLAHGSICGVDLSRFKPDPVSRNQIRTLFGIPEADMVVLYVGRLNIDKGVLDLAEAFNRIVADYRSTHLLLVGPDEEGVKEKIKQRYGSDCPWMHFADYTAVPEQYMAASDILCLPSYREGFGLVLIEAAAIGIPTIGSRIYGITDAIVDAETGLLFTVGSVDDLTEKMRCLIVDPTLRRRLGEHGRVRAYQDFSKELVLSELLKYYESLLSA